MNKEKLKKLIYDLDVTTKDLNKRGYLKTTHFEFLNSARLIRNKIGHRYKQPSIEGVIEFLENNKIEIEELYNFIKGYLS